MSDLISYTPEQLSSMEFPVKAMMSYSGSDGEEHFELVTVEAFVSGWATVTLSNGDTAKRRASVLYPMAEQATEAGRNMAKVLATYRLAYVPTVAASGKKSLHAGDAVARALEYTELDYVYGVAAQLLQVAESELRAKYAHLNVGSQRMNLGNRIRAAYKRGEEEVVRWVNARQPQQ